MKPVKKMGSKVQGKSGSASKQDADKVPTITKNKSRYEFAGKISNADGGKIDPSKHTDKM